MEEVLEEASVSVGSASALLHSATNNIQKAINTEQSVLVDRVLESVARALCTTEEATIAIDQAIASYKQFVERFESCSEVKGEIFDGKIENDRIFQLTPNIANHCDIKMEDNDVNSITLHDHDIKDIEEENISLNDISDTENIPVQRKKRKLSKKRDKSCSVKKLRKSNVEMSDNIISETSADGEKQKLSCSECNYSTTFPSNLVRHRKFKHEGGEYKNTVHKCPDCDYVAKFKGNLKRHRLSHESKSSRQLYSCDLCEYTCLNINTLKDHKESQHEDNRYPCTIHPCTYVATLKRNLQRHLDTVHTDMTGKVMKIKKVHSCTHCEYTSTNLANVKEHIRFKHEGVRHYCDKCPYAATTIGALKIHKNGIHEGVQYPCDLCDYVATQQTNLRTHRRFVHEGIKFLCDLCSYEAKTAWHLKEHVQTKHESKTYSCDACNYSTSTKDQLRKHVRFVHMGIRYPCDKCDYVAYKPFTLKRHKISRHKEEEGGNSNLEDISQAQPEKKHVVKEDDLCVVENTASSSQQLLAVQTIRPHQHDGENNGDVHSEIYYVPLQGSSL